MKVNMQLSPKKEFSRFSTNYQHLSTIQQKIAKELITQTQKRYQKKSTLLDIGCGNGNIFKQIDWNIKNFYGIDISHNMCKLHPKDKHIHIKESNFDNIEIFNEYKDKNIDIIISSSALQWSNNLNNVFKEISKISKQIAISIFTNKSLNLLQIGRASCRERV